MNMSTFTSTVPSVHHNLPEKSAAQPPTYINEEIPEPPKGSEVFVGGLSKDVSTEDLLEKFGKVGTIKQIRLMKESTGKSKGFAFIKLSSPKEAERAIKELDSDVLKGKKFGVVLSQDNHKLFVGNISKDWTHEEIFNLFREQFQGVQDISLVQDPTNPSKNRGFCFVEFDCHGSAARAHTRMSRPDYRLGNLSVSVDWAEPINEPDEETMSQVKSLYLGNLPKQTSEEEIRKIFGAYGELEGVTLSKNLPAARREDFGFVNFKERSSALAALEALNNSSLHDCVILVSLAKPVDKSFKNRLAQHRGTTGASITGSGSSAGAGGAVGGISSAPVGAIGPRDAYFSPYDSRQYPPHYDLLARRGYRDETLGLGGVGGVPVGVSGQNGSGVGEFFCHVCQISLGTSAQLEQHLEGRAHERALSRVESRKRKSESSSSGSTPEGNPKATQRPKVADPYGNWSGYYTHPTSSSPPLPPSIPHTSTSPHNRTTYTNQSAYPSQYSYDQHYTYPYPYSTQ